jgi:hypothetical protein
MSSKLWPMGLPVSQNHGARTGKLNPDSQNRVQQCTTSPGSILQESRRQLPGFGLPKGHPTRTKNPKNRRTCQVPSNYRHPTGPPSRKTRSIEHNSAQRAAAEEKNPERSRQLSRESRLRRQAWDSNVLVPPGQYWPTPEPPSGWGFAGNSLLTLLPNYGTVSASRVIPHGKRSHLRAPRIGPQLPCLPSLSTVWRFSNLLCPNRAVVAVRATS